MKRLRLFLWVLVGIAVLAVAALLLIEPRLRPTAPGTLQGSTSTGAPGVGGPFTLTGSDGRPFSSTQLAGSPYVIFFGFTNCPDVCPTTLARLTRLRAGIPGGEEKLPIVFVSVDPERDKPEDVGRYSEVFGTPVIGLTGTPAAIDQVKRQFGIYSQKVPADGGGYTVDHTASVLLMDGQGRFVSTISPGESDSVALQKMQRLVA
jgi:protein SCO1/2